jgi:hypothetical protein
MTISLKSIMRYEILGLDESFQSTCFSHAFFKTCQYATIGKKVNKNLKFVSIKYTQLNL